MNRGWRVLFKETEAFVTQRLPSTLGTPSFRWSGIMAKLSYGNRLIHYEIWVRPRQRVVEIGLHFEADALTNARLLGAFRARSKQIHRQLGDDAHIEEWDRGWARVWEPLSLALPESELRERVPRRLLEYVRALEPILREELPADVEWVEPASRRRRVTSSRSSRSGRR